eukprot:457757-Lingulodinium_polyedra.AAC.1
MARNASSGGDGMQKGVMAEVDSSGGDGTQKGVMVVMVCNWHCFYFPQPGPQGLQMLCNVLCS